MHPTTPRAHACLTLFLRTLAVCLAAPSVVGAVCPPIAMPVYVGNTATDNQCDYDSIQAAIDASTCPRTIVASGSGNYTAQHITIADKSLTLRGQSGGCGPVAGRNAASVTTTRTALVGDGANPVISITGSGNVTLSNLDISGGQGATNSLAGGGGIVVNAGGAQVTLDNLDIHDNHGGDGGGVAIYGDGTLDLRGVSIHDNHAQGSGGGLSAQSSYVGQVEVTFVAAPDLLNLIVHNDAQHDGGGIYISGNTHLDMVMPASGFSLIATNSAAIMGGGIAIHGAAVADIALPGAGINANSAGYGGGLGVAGGLLRLFNTDPSQPIALFGNDADYFGGALYLGPGSGDTHATACLRDVGIVANTAEQHGTAIAVGRAGHLSINAVDDAECDPAAVAAQGAVACSMQVSGCNEIRANNAEFTGSSYADVATIEVLSDDAVIRARRLRLADNGGGGVIRAQDATGSSLDFNSCLIVHNTVSHELVSLSGATASFDGCTFAGDFIGAARVFAHDSGMRLTRSIVQESVPVFDPASPGLDASYLVLNLPKLPADPSVWFMNADLINDFHLAATSPAIDFAPAGGDPRDLDNRPRDIDSSGILDKYGPRDLGAYERAPACYQGDTVYCDGFDS